MKQFAKKKILCTIALLLIVSMVIPLAVLQTTSAHTPTWDIPSFAYVVAQPDPVGVGQRVMIYMWVDTPMPSANVANDIRRHDYTLTITKPGGDTDVQRWDVVQDTTNVQMFPYTPPDVGDYSVLFEYDDQIYTWNGAYNNDKFLAAEATTSFTVQNDPLPDPIQSYPLPTEYWTRPIEGENTNWFTIASNWLNGPFIRSGDTATGGAGYGRYQSDGIAPNSPHIMWTKSLQDGGVVGGTTAGNDGTTYYTGGSYNTRFSGAIAMYGRLYYQESYGNRGTGGDYVCVDIRTGEELWRIDVTEGGTPSFGYLYEYDTGNQHGVLPEGLLFTRNFARSYDPSTGLLTSMTVSDVPSGTEVAGPKGEILRMILNSNGKWLAQWNSSKAVGAGTGMSPSGWYSGDIDATTAYDWNVSIANLGTGSWSIFRDVVLDDVLLLTQGSLGTGPRSNGVGANITAVSLNPNSIGQILWTRYYSPAPNNVTRVLIALDANAGIFVAEDKETLALTGYSLSNGQQVWTNTPQQDKIAWDTLREDTLCAYGNLYRAGYSGVLSCYDMATGDLLWTYGNGGPGNSTYAGENTAYGHYPIFVDIIADGKVYLGTTEHSPDSPWYKNAQYRSINATTGEEIWTMKGWGTGMYVGQYDIIADGYFVYLNCYDMQIYSVGKGPSSVTVDALPKVTTYGSSVIIEGTVIDIAAGTKQNEQAARFPYGVAAVSDESQSAWMEYVYMQKPLPTDVTGVTVALSVVDSNGNYRDIGTTTSNTDGFFTFNWMPDIEGQYTVYASFAGSESYWPSHAVTSFAVDPAPATPAPTNAPLVSMTDAYFIPAVAGIIVAIVIVGIMLALLLVRKRP